MKVRFPFHPIVLAAIPALLFYLANAGEAKLSDLSLPVAVSEGLVLAVWMLAALAYRDLGRSALFASAFIAIFFSYGHALDIVQGWTIGGAVVGRNRTLLMIWAAMLVLAAGGIRMAGKAAIDRTGTPRANLFAAVILVLALLQVGIAGFKAHAPPGEGEAWAAQAGVTSKPPDASRLPDIYYIIPDSYESEGGLRAGYGMDNTPFTDFLRSKGFQVRPHSHSNYAFTALSLPSSLNMAYLGWLTDSMGRESNDRRLLEDVMQNNSVMAFLKSAGYTIINAGSWWGPSSRNRGADINLRADVLDEFGLKFLRTTLLLPFSEEFSENSLRNKVLYTFDRLEEIPSLPAPTFTFAHVLCPHPPFIFGPDGGKVPTAKRVVGKTQPRDLYRDQVLFVNSKLKEAVEAILSKSPSPPVIVIQGDHGAAYVRAPMGYAHLVPDSTYLREQMGILNAYFVPGMDSAEIPDGITPVNTFRLLFNKYLGAHFPMLPDSSYYSTHGHPFDFTNVTGIVTIKR